jgi:hypothetical protein
MSLRALICPKPFPGSVAQPARSRDVKRHRRTGPGRSDSLATFDRMTDEKSFGVVDFGGSDVAGA